ncbi:MAG: cytochrome c biogenesis CcdA family protein [Desertimonas sp.]
MGSEVGYVAALVGGVLALLSPCGALLLPSFFAYAFERRSQLLARTAVFYAGLVTTLVPLGVSASSLTVFVRSHQETVITVSGIVIIVLGVLTAVGGGFVMLRRGADTAGQSSNPASIYALGLAYGLTGFCTGPILGSILVLAAAGGQPVRGGVMLAIYAVGMTVPLVMLSLVWGRLGQGVTRWLRGRAVHVGRFTFHSTSLVSGLLLAAVGVFMLANGDSLVENQDVALAGARAEEWALDAGAMVSDEALAVVALIGAGAWFVARWRKSD